MTKSGDSSKKPVESSSTAEELKQIDSIPTSRVGRMLRTGWLARKAVPLALKRAMDLASTDKAERQEAAERILLQQEAYAEELFQTLGTMKGMAQKVGQILSYMEGVLPPEFAPVYQKVLARLQASAPALPPDVSQNVIEEELDCLLEDHFATFEEKPFAAASIGQVHRATLHDGTKVAVKVQYPDVDEAFASDMKNLKFLEALFSPLVRYYQGKEILEWTRQQLLDELDYEREARAQLRMASLFEGHPRIHIPRVFPALSSRKVLVTEFVEGMSFEEVRAAPQEVRDRVGETMFLYYWECIFLHQFINSDPHPGNYIFHEDGRLSCLDFGAAVDLELAFVRRFQNNIETFLAKDEALFRDSVASTYGFGQDEPVVFNAYVYLIDAFLEPFDPEHQPFTFRTEWMEKYIETSVQKGKNILTRGGKVPRLPPPPLIPRDLPLMQRIGLGLSSLLSRLDATAHWDKLAAGVFARVSEHPPQSTKSSP